MELTLVAEMGHLTIVLFFIGCSSGFKYLGKQDPSAGLRKDHLLEEVGHQSWAVPWMPSSPCDASRVCSLAPEIMNHTAIVKRALSHTTNSGVGTRLCGLKRRLLASASPSSKEGAIKIVVLGGSLTAGTFLHCLQGDKAVSVFECAWPKHLERELNKFAAARGTTHVDMQNLAKGGSTSFWAINEFHRIPRDADLYLIDYDVNDGALLNDIPRSAPTARRMSRMNSELEPMREKIVAASEVLLRWLFELPSHPAVAWIDTFAFDGKGDPDRVPHLTNATCSEIYGRGYNVVDARRRVMDYYGVPRLSIRDAVWPSINCPTGLWECSNTCHHPRLSTHRLMAHLAFKLLHSGIRDCLGKSDLEESGRKNIGALSPKPLTAGASEIEVSLGIGPVVS